MTHERLFRLLLRAFPRDFRERYGAEMTELFLRRLAGARRGGARARAWVRAATDVLRAALAERVGTVHSRGGDGTMATLVQDIRYAARRLARSPSGRLPTRVPARW